MFTTFQLNNLIILTHYSKKFNQIFFFKVNIYVIVESGLQELTFLSLKSPTSFKCHVKNLVILIAS